MSYKNKKCIVFSFDFSAKKSLYEFIRKEEKINIYPLLPVPRGYMYRQGMISTLFYKSEAASDNSTVIFCANKKKHSSKTEKQSYTIHSYIII